MFGICSPGGAPGRGSALGVYYLLLGRVLQHEFSASACCSLLLDILFLPGKNTHHLRGQLHHTSLRGKDLEDNDGEIFPSGQHFSTSPGCSFCLEGEMARGTVGISSWALANGLAGGQGLGRLMIEKLMTRRSREQVCG